MSYKIVFKRSLTFDNSEILWTLEGTFSREFTAGFLYCALYVLTKSEYKKDYFLVTGPPLTLNKYAKVQPIEESYGIDDYEGLSSYFRIAHDFNIVNQNIITREFTENLEKTRHPRMGSKYIIWLRYHFNGHGTDRAIYYEMSNVDFIQGIMTAKNAFNVPEIILYKIYKDVIQFFAL